MNSLLVHLDGLCVYQLDRVDGSDCPAQLRRHTLVPERLGYATCLLEVIAAGEKVYAFCGPDLPGVLAKHCVQELAGRVLFRRVAGRQRLAKPGAGTVTSKLSLVAAILPDSELDPAHLVRGSGSRSSDLKEALHLGIFQSVVAAAGCTFSVENIDQGIDVMVHQRIPGVPGKATIDFQLKCTATDITSGGEVVVELPLQRYDEMRHKDKNQPFLLVAQHVAANEDDWVDFSGDKSLFAVKNYWLNLTGFGDSSVTSGKVRVKVPTHQVFDDNQLIQFFAQLRKGALPQ